MDEEDETYGDKLFAKVIQNLPKVSKIKWIKECRSACKLHMLNQYQTQNNIGAVMYMFLLLTRRCLLWEKEQF